MRYPLISTVIPAYNYGHTLAEALNSALAQDYPNHEVLVLDNASTDDTQEVLARYAGHPRLRSVRNAVNIGAIKNHNLGIVESRGAYLHFLSADDRCAPNFISSSHAYLTAHPNVDIVFSELRFMSSDGSPRAGRRALIAAEHDNHPHQLAAFLTYGCYAAFPTMLVPRNIYNLHGPLDERFAGADFELIVRWAAAGIRFGYLPETFFEFRIHAGQESGASFTRSGKSFNEFLDILDKYVIPETIPKLRGSECGIIGHCQSKLDISKKSGYVPDPAATARLDDWTARMFAIRADHIANPVPSDISIVILAERDSGNLQRTLRSLVDQTWEQWEALIVHPSDAGVRFEDPTSRLKNVCLSEPLNEAGALNVALRLARGNRFLFLRSGNTFPPEHLERIAWTFDNFPCDVLVTPPTLRVETGDGVTEAPVFMRPGDRALARIAPTLALDGFALSRFAFDLYAQFSDKMAVLAEWDRLTQYTLKNARVGVITNSTVYLHEEAGIANHYVRSRKVVESLRLVYSFLPPPDARTRALREAYVADISATLAAMQNCAWSAEDHSNWYRRLDGRRFALDKPPAHAGAASALGH